MAIETINIGSAAGTGDGDLLRDAWGKAVRNFAALDARLLSTASGLAAEIARAAAAEKDGADSLAAEIRRAVAAEALKAPLGSPAFTGTPTVPTAPAGTATAQAASTAFSAVAVASETARAQAAEALLAPKARRVAAGPGLAGGGDLSNDLTLALAGISTGTLLANLSGMPAAPVAVGPSALLDALGATRGSILYRGASGWSLLPPGAVGHGIISNGPDADPSFQAITTTGTVPASRQILGAGLAAGGGDLTADRTVTVPAASQADVAAGVDQTKALTPYSVAAAFGALAPLASPAFTGTPTAPTAAASANSGQIATTAYTDRAVAVVGQAASQAASQAAAAAAAAVQKTGDTMTGTLKVDSGTIQVGKTGTPGATGANLWQLVGAADGRLSVQRADGSNSFLFGSDGTLSIPQFGDLNSRIETRGQQWAQWGVNQCATDGRWVYAGDLALNYYPGSGGFIGAYGGYAMKCDYWAQRLAEGACCDWAHRYRYFQLYIPNRGWFTCGAAS